MTKIAKITRYCAYVVLTVSIETVSTLSGLCKSVSPSEIRKAVGKGDEFNGKATKRRTCSRCFVGNIRALKRMGGETSACLLCDA